MTLTGLGVIIIEVWKSLWHTTLSSDHLNQWSGRCRDLYLTTHNTHKRQTSMPSPGFEPTIQRHRDRF